MKEQESSGGGYVGVVFLGGNGQSLLFLERKADVGASKA